MSRKGWIAAVIVAALLIGGGSAVLVANRSDDKASTSPKQQSSASTKKSSKKSDPHDDYQRVLDRVSNIVEGDHQDGGSPIESADPSGLTAFAKDWRTAIELLTSVTPPKDAASAHADLVEAMKRLAPFNDKMAAAAPDKDAVTAALDEGNADPASDEFHQAQCTLRAAGYEILSAEDCAGS